MLLSRATKEALRECSSQCIPSSLSSVRNHGSDAETNVSWGKSKSSGDSVTLGSLPGCPVLVPGHSHILAFWNGAWGSHIHQPEFLPYSAAIFRALHFGLFETEARVSGLLMEKVGLSLLWPVLSLITPEPTSGLTISLDCNHSQYKSGLPLP